MEESPLPSGPPPSVATRVFWFVGGIIALAIGALITLGIGLVGAVAIGVTAVVLKRKNRRLTRRGAWFTSVGWTVGVLAVLFGLAVLTNDTKTPTAAERAEQRARATQAMPDWMKVVNPNAQKQTQAADSIAASLLSNKAVVVWAGLMGAVIGAGLMGTIAGSFVWGGTLLLQRSWGRESGVVNRES